MLYTISENLIALWSRWKAHLKKPVLFHNIPSKNIAETCSVYHKLQFCSKNTQVRQSFQFYAMVSFRVRYFSGYNYLRSHIISEATVSSESSYFLVSSHFQS